MKRSEHSHYERRFAEVKQEHWRSLARSYARIRESFLRLTAPGPTYILYGRKVMKALDREAAIFESRRAEFEKEHYLEWVVICGEEVAGFYSDLQEAAEVAIERRL